MLLLFVLGCFLDPPLVQRWDLRRRSALDNAWMYPPYLVLDLEMLGNSFLHGCPIQGCLLRGVSGAADLGDCLEYPPYWCW